jgi:uncharacterized protein YdeI (YjbR/CyaY-like superfamily)
VEPVYFSSAEELRAWLDAHHESETELVVGIYKKNSGVQGIDWAALVDEVLCFGWIDGKARRIDDDRYCIRITPRKQGSIWSNRNIARVAALLEEGRMHPGGLQAYEARSTERSGVYSFEQEEEPELSPEFASMLEGNDVALAYFQSQAPWYRRAAAHWVMSAKREATRERRMNELIEDSANGRTIKPLTRNR